MDSEQEFTVKSVSKLVSSDKVSIDKQVIEKRFKSFDNSSYNLTGINTDNLVQGLSIPFKELTTLKKTISHIVK